MKTRRKHCGQSLVEYGILIALVGLAGVAALVVFGSNLADTASDMGENIVGETPSTAAATTPAPVAPEMGDAGFDYESQNGPPVTAADFTYTGTGVTTVAGGVTDGPAAGTSSPSAGSDLPLTATIGTADTTATTTSSQPAPALAQSDTVSTTNETAAVTTSSGTTGY